jgi:predicted nucleic acid-binding protein
LIVYFDTSSFIKLYVEEVGSDAVRELKTSGELAASSVVLYVELRAALARMLSSRLDQASYLRSLRRFESDWPYVATVPLDDPLVSFAAELAERHRLRALDAIHLASAATLSRQEDVVVSAWDRSLLDAAVAEGIRVVEP